MATQRLTIYLLRNIDEPDQALAPDKESTKIVVDAQNGLGGAFYYMTRPPRTPPWVAFVREIVPSLPALTASSASGLLIVEAQERYFALTFGYGRSLLDLSKTEPQFGLRVALNRIDPSQLRSLDTKTFEDLVVTRTIQTSKSTELPTFGVDISSDILRAVTGAPRDATLAKRLYGADALVLGIDKAAAELSDILSQVLSAFSENTYQENFSWIDHLSLVNDASTVNQLDQQLAAGDTSATHMATPETINWEDIESFKVTGTSGRVFDDLDIDEYLAAIGSHRTQLTVSLLKGRRVAVGFSRSSEYDDRWSFYNCLISEQRIRDNLYVLIEGRWLSVSNSLAEEVDNYTNSLPAVATALIESKQGEKEPDYNRRLALKHENQALLLDAKIKIPGGAASGVELCDVLTLDGEFIHIKRKSRSATLSHLFAQGAVSAATFVSDGTFRDKIRQEIENTVDEIHKPRWLQVIPSGTDTIDRSKYAVSYVVIANSSRTGSDWLPFFSKLNLMQQGKQVQRLGFGVSISRVPIGT